jgi:hypothetical protein
MDEVMQKIPENKDTVISLHMNEHVGSERVEYEKVHRR